MFISDTIAAVATGFSNSGIGIIRISGPDAFPLLKKIFRTRSGRSYDEFESHRVYYGYIFDGKSIVDEVLVITMKSPKSYTTEDTVEINCHGGNLVLNRVFEIVVHNGARPAEPGEFTSRAFLNGRIDLSEAESVLDVIESKNDLSLKNSLDQLTGRLSSKIGKIREKMLSELGFIEAALDDPEHISLEGYYERAHEVFKNIYEELKALLDSYNNGRIIKEGIKTVILGKPNVGKSSLLNYLSGKEKAIVTDIPGTTRDIIEENVNLNGLSLIIYDTAGIRDSKDIIESIGINRAKEIIGDADLVIFVLDSSLPLDNNDREIFGIVKEKKTILLLNKSDLSVKLDPLVLEKENIYGFPVVNASVKDNTGIDELGRLISSMFLTGDLSYDDEVVITNERHKFLIEKSMESLSNSMSSLEAGMPEDFVSIDLRDSYDLLGMILGEKISDDIVNEIFSKFCMGK